MYSISVGENFTPPTLTAYDNDGVLPVTVAGIVDTDTVGTYYITYTAENEYATTTLTITVHVTNNPIPGDYLPYYSSINGLTGNALLNTLTELLNNTADIRSYGGNLNSVLINADKHPTLAGMVYTIYDGAAMSEGADGSSGSSVWNKEHVIPKSWYINDGYADHEGDVHNLRISRASINSTRSNDMFVTGSGSWDSSANGFYPGDDHKGDVARIAMYMIVMMPDVLNFNKIINNGQEVLLNWHKEDPVDDFEIRRNQILFEFQGNRNPFIDHPEIADLIWGTSSNHNRTFYQKLFLQSDDAFTSMIN